MFIILKTDYLFSKKVTRIFTARKHKGIITIKHFNPRKNYDIFNLKGHLKVRISVCLVATNKRQNG